MGNYATNAHVTPRLGWTISAASTKPTTGQVDTEIALIEADLDGELVAQGFTAPVTNATGISYLRQFVVAEACARALELRDTVTDEQDAGPQIAAFRALYDKLILDIRQVPAIVAEKIYQGFGSTASAGRLRSYPTDNDDGLSRSNGDFDPIVTRKKEW